MCKEPSWLYRPLIHAKRWVNFLFFLNNHPPISACVWPVQATVKHGPVQLELFMCKKKMSETCNVKKKVPRSMLYVHRCQYARAHSPQQGGAAHFFIERGPPSYEGSVNYPCTNIKEKNQSFKFIARKDGAKSSSKGLSCSALLSLGRESSKRSYN